jgi:hypothetical protein
MRLSTIMILLSAASAGLATFGLWAFCISLAPVPGKLETFTGVATEIRTHTVRHSKAHATFKLQQADGKVIEFSYTPYFKRFYYFAERVKNGMRIEVTTGPGGRQDFWGLKLGSQVLMTPAEAQEARIADGRWGLALFGGFLITAVWAATEARSGRRKGI